jgi:hypothetical protein
MRLVVIIGGVVALLLIAFLVLSGGGGTPESLGPTATPSRPIVRPSASPSPSLGEIPLPETDQSFEGKDPFQPLVTAGGGGGTPAPGVSPTPTSTANPTGGGQQAHHVTLEDIFTQNGTRFATVKVDDKEYTVREGETFDDNFKVLSLGKSCGTFVFGDETFTLCVGQEVLK